MRYMSRRAPVVAGLVLLLAVASATCAAETAPSAEEAAAPKTAVVAPVSLRTLYANVYLQTSAEYRACCYGIYAAAGYRLEELMEDADPAPLRPAVVMDLDMTVLDVSSFQTFLYENGIKYTPQLWDEFERGGVDDLLLVPGAKDFIDRAEGLGVTVVYLSNRNERNQEWTVAGLERLGLDTTSISERIYLKPEGGSSDKSPRRDAVSARFNVLMCLGDNLRDFSEVFAPAKLSADATIEDHLAAIAERSAAVDDAACHWGIDWFVLPNPIYGEWEKLVSEVPEETLRPSSQSMTWQ